ncbi:hypothetical protein [Mycolicibacterium peregrinum]|uniref:hypothetical protein n=1 Tax=Mycolicibacterium peregrinum TaxID=43304 RepID=UPI0026C4C80A
MGKPVGKNSAVTRSARVIIASTRAAAGVYDDRTGPLIVGWLSDRGYDVTEQMVVADGHAVGDALRAALADRVTAEFFPTGFPILPFYRLLCAAP